MSAFKALASDPGTAVRRSPGRSLPARIKAGLLQSRARYLVPPLVALLVVVGVQLYNGTSVPAPTTVTSAVGETHQEGVADPVPVTEVTSIGAVDTSDIDRRIAFWRARADENPRSELEWVYIGSLFDLKGRQTGDVSHFVAAQEAYDRAIAIAPNSGAAYGGAARIKATLHDFEGAVIEATKVLEIDPAANDAIGVIFDASIELGDLENARLALERLDDRIDSPAVTIREARLAFVGGDAVAAHQLALGASQEAFETAEQPSTIAFYEYSAAEYALLSGDLDAADHGYADAIASLPGFPLAVYGQARVAYARGDIGRAISLSEAATASVPRPDMLAFLGDLYALDGQADKAADQYATVEFIASMASESAGAVYDREYSVYLSDHGIQAEHALSLAQAESAVRHDAYGHDALAWALYANGRDAEALTEINRALATGTVDARLLIHAGLIQIANGDVSEGKNQIERGLDLHPAFSPVVIAMAREALR